MRSSRSFCSTICALVEAGLSRTASAFASTFYQGLLAGKPLGPCVSAAREAVAATKSADWADYLHYGSPNFVLKLQDTP